MCYDSNSGTYINQSPIDVEGNNPKLYAYAFDSNTGIDPFELMAVFYHAEDIIGDIDPSIGRSSLDSNPAGRC